MATLWVCETGFIAAKGYQSSSRDGLLTLPPSVEQTVSFGASSSAFAAGTKAIRVWADADCHIAIGASPSASTSNMPLAEKTAEYFLVSPGDKVSVVSAV